MSVYDESAENSRKRRGPKNAHTKTKDQRFEQNPVLLKSL
jgi:hypothetical protein